MKRYFVRFAVAFLTFSIGALAADLMTVKHSSPEEVVVRPVPPMPASSRLAHAEHWKKIRIGRISFSIPANLEKTGLPGNVGVIGAFGGPFVGQDELYVNYSYGTKIGSDFNVPAGEPVELRIDGKQAILYITKFEDGMLTNWKYRPGMELVVPDVGDGRTRFEIYAVGFNSDLIRQIIDSVEIHD